MEKPTAPTAAIKPIYLGSPYSHAVRTVRELRYKAASIVAAKLMSQGHMVFSPIAHSHSITTELNQRHYDRDEATAWEIWQAFDIHMLTCSDCLWVLVLRDWQKSRGLAAEIKFAKENNLRVEYVTPQYLELDLDDMLYCNCLMPSNKEVYELATGVSTK